jgi:hypothetical protein
MRYPLRQWPSAGRIRIVSVMKARSYLAQQEARDRYMTNQSSVGGHLSFPKIPSGRIRAMRENQGIIHRDACDAPSAWDVCRKPVQVAAPA